MKTVSQFMEEDHKRLDELWSNFLAKKEEAQESFLLFQKFITHLRTHIELEDTFLFPRFNKRIGFSDNEGPVAVLSRDHLTILHLLDKADKFRKIKNYEKLLQIGQNLQKLLSKHIQREVQMGYPVFDTFISSEEFDKIVKKIYKK